MAELIHQTAVEYMLKKDPDLKLNGFAKAVREIYEDEDEDELLEFALGFLPIAYKIIDGGQYDSCHTVVICEIEGAPLPSEEEMKQLVTLWQLLDFEGHSLEIKIYGRFGHFVKNRPIQTYHEKIANK